MPSDFPVDLATDLAEQTDDLGHVAIAGGIVCVAQVRVDDVSSGMLSRAAWKNSVHEVRVSVIMA
jgi:hypothetical protein